MLASDRYDGISIHPPLAGRDHFVLILIRIISVFQSTRPLRGGTPETGAPPPPTGISIHPPLAGRDFDFEILDGCYFISIHPPLAGRDIVGAAGKDPLHISIHPPLAGRDSDPAQKNCAKHRILHKKCIYPGRIERFSGFDAAIFLPNVHKFRCEPSEESLLAPRSHAYTIRTPSG